MQKQAANHEVILRLLALKQVRKLTAATLQYIQEHDRMLKTFDFEKEREMQQVDVFNVMSILLKSSTQSYHMLHLI